jgi:hypothetical protein
VAFSRKTELQLRDQARRVKAAPYFRHDTFFAPRLSQGGSVLRAVVTTAIPSGTISAPSTTGAATVHRWINGADVAETNAPWVDLQIYNDHSLGSSIAVGKTIKITWIDGFWWLLQADC